MEGTELARFRVEAELARHTRGWSVRRLAQEAELNPGAVSRFLRGKGPRPEATTVLKIARALGMATGSLSDATLPPTPVTTQVTTRPPPSELQSASEDYIAGFRAGVAWANARKPPAS